MLAQVCKTATSSVFHELETSSYLECPSIEELNTRAGFELLVPVHGYPGVILAADPEAPYASL